MKEMGNNKSKMQYNLISVLIYSKNLKPWRKIMLGIAQNVNNLY
jgi:hypothetical protein